MIEKKLLENAYPWTCIVQARRLGHALLHTPDLERQLAYYTDLVGFNVVARERGKAYLASRAGQLAIEMQESDIADCKALSFEVSSDVNFAEVAKALQAHGIASEVRSDSLPTAQEVLAFRDPKGTEIVLFKGWERLIDARKQVGISPLKFGHIAFTVTDIAKVVEFYRTVLGFRESDWIEDYFVFMRCNADHHTANFIQGRSSRMHHIAFELQDAGHLRRACDLVGQNGGKIIWGPGRHSVGHNMFAYHRDADDHIIEYYCELDQMQDESLGHYVPRPWHQDFPQRPRVWLQSESMSWGVPPTEDFKKQRHQ